MIDSELTQVVNNAVARMILINKTADLLRPDVTDQFVNGAMQLEQDDCNFSETKLFSSRSSSKDREDTIRIDSSLKLLLAFGFLDSYLFKECAPLEARGFECWMEKVEYLLNLQETTSIFTLRKIAIEAFDRNLLSCIAPSDRFLVRSIYFEKTKEYIFNSQDRTESMRFISTDPLINRKLPEGIENTDFYKLAFTLHPKIVEVVCALGLELRFIEKLHGIQPDLQMAKFSFVNVLSFNYWISQSKLGVHIKALDRKEVILNLYKIFLDNKKAFQEILIADFITAPMLGKGNRTVNRVVQEMEKPGDFTRFLVGKELIIEEFASSGDTSKIVQTMEGIFLDNKHRAETIFSLDLYHFYRNYRKSGAPKNLLNYLKECYEIDPKIFKFFESVFCERKNLKIKKYLPNFLDLRTLFFADESLAHLLTSEKFLRLYGVGIDAKYQTRKFPSICRLVGCDLKSFQNLRHNEPEIFEYIVDNVDRIAQALELFREPSKREDWFVNAEVTVNLDELGVSDSQGQYDKPTTVKFLSSKVDTDKVFDFSRHIIDFDLWIYLGIGGIERILQKEEWIKLHLSKSEFDLKFNRKDDWFVDALIKACPEFEKPIKRYRPNHKNKKEEVELDSGDESIPNPQFVNICNIRATAVLDANSQERLGSYKFLFQE